MTGAAETGRTRKDSEERAELVSLLAEVLGFARRREYTGWDYADGMSSRIRQRLPVENKWVNLTFQETAKRAPVNVRPLLLVEQRRSFMGAALFAMANLTVARQRRALDRVPPAVEGVDYVAEAHDLLDWLVDHRSTGYSGFCGGHQHEQQGLSGRSSPNDSDLVSTAFAVQALIDGSALDARYPELARTAVDVVLDDWGYEEVSTGAKVTYYEGHDEDAYTINAGAIGGGLFLDLYDHFGDEEFEDRARDILDHVVTLQTDDGGWYYREPPSASHLSMDTHHNGFILGTLLRYGEITASSRYDEAIAAALEFHRSVLFDSDGAPNFDEERTYPRDVHAAAQGIVVFSRAGDFEFARRILDWTLENLYDGNGRFYFRKHRLFTKRHTLMRWGQAWMAQALAIHASQRFDAPNVVGLE